MRGLGAAELLEIADASGELSWIDKGLLLVSHAWPGSSKQDGEALPIGMRDRLILALRVATFGREMALRARCGHCGEELEATVDAVEILKQHVVEPPASVAIEVEGERLQLRLPSSLDLIATAGLGKGEAEWALLERCLGAPLRSRSEALRSAAAVALSEADPIASIELDLNCGPCGESTAVPLDVVPFFLQEIEAGAQRTALDVHALALAYGWPEAEILQMPARRRKRYLDMVSP